MPSRAMARSSIPVEEQPQHVKEYKEPRMVEERLIRPKSNKLSLLKSKPPLPRTSVEKGTPRFPKRCGGSKRFHYAETRGGKIVEQKRSPPGVRTATPKKRGQQHTPGKRVQRETI